MPPKLTTPVERRTLADQIYASLKQAIVSGELRPGERLKEVELGRLLGASRTPVREALTWLEQEGLVTPRPIVGLTVAELSEDDMQEIFGLLKVLESYAAELAADGMSEKQLQRLEAVCAQAEEMAQIGDDHLSDLNWRFHELLVEGSGNRRLQAVIKTLRTSMQPYRALTLTSTRFRRQSVSDHRQIVMLLRTKAKEQLHALMTEHLEVAQQVTVTALRDRASRLAAEKRVSPTALRARGKQPRR